MKSIIKIAAVLTLVSSVGCSQDGKPANDKPATEPVKESDTGVFKKQLETLDQAKQVGQMLQNEEEQQRQKIEDAAK